MIKAAIFDMDGTLLDTEQVYSDSFLEVTKAHDLPDLGHVFMQLVGVSGEGTKRILTPHLKGKVSFDQFLEEWFEAVGRRLSEHVPVKEGVLELLTKLRNKGLLIAVATSSSHENAVSHLTKAGLIGYFEHIVGGDQVENRKPDPEPFLTAAELLGIDIKDCVIFEDSEPGTLGAVRSGGQVVQIPDLTEPTPETRALGHVIAPNLLQGAREIGVI